MACEDDLPTRCPYCGKLYSQGQVALAILMHWESLTDAERNEVDLARAVYDRHGLIKGTEAMVAFERDLCLVRHSRIN
jgi:hypothetical protein